jgi:tyrosinase
VADIEPLQRRAEQLLLKRVDLEQAIAPEADLVRARQPFSVFRTHDLERSLGLADRWMAVASVRGGTDGLDDALGDAERVRVYENPDLVEHALLVFLTHFPEALRLPIPSLLERHPGLFEERGVLTADLADEEESLAYWRADPLANQHHEHWHVVYPSAGVPTGTGARVTKKRHGELFVYMHQQMLARYDAERLSLGLARAVAYADYNQPLAEGYDPQDPDYGPRAPGRNPAVVDPTGVADQIVRRTVVEQAVAAGNLPGGAPLTTDGIGELIEASGEWGAAETGGLHNNGHVVIAGLSDAKEGVMANTRTAIMDPAFFRWHRHIDDLTEGQAGKQTPHDFADAPPVRFASGGALLCFTDAIPGFRPVGPELQQWADVRFGGANWDSTSDLAVTDELETFMTKAESMGPRPYLDHRDFAYVFRLENASRADVDVTLRLFAAPEAWVEERRMWIEMDKIPTTVPAGAKVVVSRWGGDASVVQREKGAGRPPHPRRDPIVNADGRGDPWAVQNYCNCGWPFHLLVPRGTTSGLGFQLAVMATDAEQDLKTHDPNRCGSLSFCGARDVEYPDRRPMGYPFDRPFAGDTVTTVLGSMPSVFLRSFSIRHTTV